MPPGRQLALHGRKTLVNGIWEDLLTRQKAAPKPAATILFGPRGSGKTAVLDNLWTKAVDQAAQPHSSVFDLATHPDDTPGWRLIADLALELAEPKWQQFGRLRFPRLTLGAMVLDGQISDDSPAAAQEAILRLLRPSPSGDTTTGVLGLLPHLLGFPDALEALPEAVRSVLGMKALVKRRYRTGMAFYSAALRTAADGGLTALRKLATAAPAEADLVLAGAFLEDLRGNYAHGFRPRECLVLLDNAHSPAGTRVLSALIRARGDAPTPATIVATSGRLDLSLPGLALTDVVTAWNSMPTDHDKVRTRGTAPQAIRLTPLTSADVTALAGERRAVGAVAAQVSGGNPWTAQRVLSACEQLGDRPDERALRGLFEVKVGDDHQPLAEVAARYLVLDDLSPAVDTGLAAVARDLTHAAALPGAANAPWEFAIRCWLDGPAALPDWLRRVLIAAEPARDWAAATGALAEVSPGHRRYYQVANGELADAVSHLNDRFDHVDPDTWIAEFQALAVAPCLLPPASDVWTEHSGLVARLRRADGELPPGDAHGERRLTIIGMLVAGWLGADRTRDPNRTLATVLAQGYRDLGRRSPAGQLRFAAEANRR